MSQAPTPTDLAGRLRLFPGCALPSIASTRPTGLHALALGRPAAELPALLGALHALCGAGHRLAAALAVAAAQGGPAVPDGAALATLQAATAREQLLRLLHDWPRRLPGVAPGLAAEATQCLRSCPLFQAGAAAAGPAAAGLAPWLQQHLLGLPVADWLAAWRAAPLAWPLHWASTARTPLARWLAGQHAATSALATPTRPWTALADPAARPRLAAALRQPGFTAAPCWPPGPDAADARGAQGGDGSPGAPAGAPAGVPDTGPWSRLHDRVAPAAHNAWMRLVSRLVDLLHLATPEGAAWLAVGAWPVGPGTGLAWVECARGLLVHQVRLADGADGPRVAALQVLAPTDWNAHPRGVLAEALAALPADDADGATRLALAFDPCVPFEIAAAPALRGVPQHA